MSRFRLRVGGENPVPPLVLTGAPAATAQVGAPYSFTPVASGGQPPLVFALAGTLPDGLSFNTATGAITGTPT